MQRLRRAMGSLQQFRDVHARAAGIRPGLQRCHARPARGSELFRTESQRALKASNLLVERVKKAGAIRPDFDRTDFYILLHANAGLVRGTHRSAPLAWKRFAEYMLQAFTSDGGALEPPSSTWMRASAAGKHEVQS